MPDLKIEPQYHSVFTISLFGQGIIEDFARKYYKEHPLRGSEMPEKFTLTDSEYQEFVDFAKDKKIELKSETEGAIKILRNIATREKYINKIENQLKALENEMRSENKEYLIAFRSEIQPLIENDIIIRYQYRQGVIRHSLTSDNELKQIISILNDNTELERLLNKDTERK
jgi:carboxyl-terminal processing protease